LCADAAGLADVPEGKVLQVDATLTALHPITEVFAGLTRKTLLKPESSYDKPNEGSTVVLSVEVRGEDGAVLEERQDVEFVLDEEQVGGRIVFVCVWGGEQVGGRGHRGGGDVVTFLEAGVCVLCLWAYGAGERAV
jgi:hypothetical protein